jgi:hypothetical protein
LKIGKKDKDKKKKKSGKSKTGGRPTANSDSDDMGANDDHSLKI